MKIEIAENSIIGSREEQQDACYAYTDGARAFAVVCDGMGGTQGGADASWLTASKLKEILEAKSAAESWPAFFLRTIDILDEAVVNLQKQPEHSSCGTTVVAAVVEREQLYWMSVGDSRLYILRANEIVQVTRDHNFALSLEQWSAQESETAATTLRNPRADALISFIGMGGIKIYDVNQNAFQLLCGDKILLTSDGITKLLADAEIRACLANTTPQSGLAQLFAQATQKAKNAQDNSTCVLIQIERGI